MRAVLLLAVSTLIAGCSDLFPTRAEHSCETASQALRVHDSKIDAARMAGSLGFTAKLASRGYQTYHCITTRGDQIACSTIESGLAAQHSTRVNRLLRERSAIEDRVARACKI